LIKKKERGETLPPVRKSKDMQKKKKGKKEKPSLFSFHRGKRDHRKCRGRKKEGSCYPFSP